MAQGERSDERALACGRRAFLGGALALACDGPRPPAIVTSEPPPVALAPEPSASAAPPPEVPPWDLGDRSESRDTMLMFRGDARRNFQGTGPLADTLRVVWQKRLGSFESTRARDGRVIRWEGTGWTGQPVVWGSRVYVGALDRKLYCWDRATGDERWSFEAQRMFKSSACLYRGKLYIGNVDDYVRCIDAERGAELWRFMTGADCDSSGVVVDDTLYIGGESGHLRALDPATGEERWRAYFGTGGEEVGSRGIESSPAIDGDEVFVSNSEGTLYAYDRRERRVRWRFEMGGDADVTPLVTDDFVLAATQAPVHKLFCIDRATRRERWSVSARPGWWSTPAVSSDRKVYAAGGGGRFFCLDLDTGRELWRVNVGQAVWSSPCVIDDKVLFGAEDAKLHIHDRHTGREISTFEVEGQILSTPCVVGGHVYVGTIRGHFYGLA